MRWSLLDVTKALFVCCILGSCSTIEPGSQLSLAPVTYDENYFYCEVEPKVLTTKSCGSGNPAQGDTSGGCHANVTSFKLTTVMPVTCNGLVPTGAISADSQNNYQSAQSEMSLDIENIPLLAWPTQKISSHPRQVFAPDSAEAKIIQDWATKYATH